jgi:hypothetical protein
MLSDAVSSATKKRSSSLGTNRLLKKASCLFQNTKTKKCDFYFFLRNQRLTSRRFRQDIHALVAGGRNSVNFNSLLKRLCGSQNVLVRREAARSATAAAVVRKYNAGAERRCPSISRSGLLRKPAVVPVCLPALDGRALVLLALFGSQSGFSLNGLKRT